MKWIRKAFYAERQEENSTFQATSTFIAFYLGDFNQPCRINICVKRYVNIKKVLNTYISIIQVYKHMQSRNECKFFTKNN